MPKYELQYFNLRARGEISRLLFVAADKEFTDTRIEFKDWPAVKSTYDLGQLPLLIVTNDDGSVFKLSQSMAIARYLANEFGFFGANNQERARIDCLCDAMLDAFNCGPKIKFASNDDVREAERKKLQNEVLPSLYAFLEQKLKDNNGKYFVGSKPSLADMFFSVTVKFLSDAGGVDQEKALANFPQIKTLNDMIGNCPKMAKYLAERPKCDV